MAKKKVTQVVEVEVDDVATFGAKATKTNKDGEPAEGNIVSVLPSVDDVLKRIEDEAACGDPKREAKARDMLVIARAAFGV